MPDMTVEQAEAALADAQQRFEGEQQAVLDRIADELPAKLDALGKKVAHGQPEVTKALGADGVLRLRADLAAASKVLVNDLRSARTLIAWPVDREEGRNGKETRHVHRAVFDYLHGDRINRVAQVFADHGYRVFEGFGTRQTLVLSDSLYDEKDFVDVYAFGVAVYEALRVRDRAQAAADDAEVESLWD